MANPLEKIQKHPKLAKQIIGLTLPKLEQLIKPAISEAVTAWSRKARRCAIALDNQLKNKKRREVDKFKKL